MGKFDSLIQSSQNDAGILSNNLLKNNLLNDNLLGDSLLGGNILSDQSSATEQNQKGLAETATVNDSRDGYYYATDGNFIAKVGDGKSDVAYVIDPKNVQFKSDGKTVDKEKTSGEKSLPIGNKELLDRATWVHGECGGSVETITERVQNAGDASQTANARVVDYYAHAINNGATKSGGFYKGILTYMSKKVDGKVQNTSSGYFTGDGIGGNGNSKDFANAREKGMTSLMKVPKAMNSISAVIGSVNGGADPTGGCRVWLGADDAKKYVNDAKKKTAGAGFQFSFSSEAGKFNHSFWRK